MQSQDKTNFAIIAVKMAENLVHLQGYIPASETERKQALDKSVFARFNLKVNSNKSFKQLIEHISKRVSISR